MINATKLDAELKSAGIPIDGVSSDGIISFKIEVTTDQKILAQQILDNHIPGWYVNKRLSQDGYFSIGDQLDMIYWDKINGTQNWIKHINEVKSKFPK